MASVAEVEVPVYARVGVVELLPRGGAMVVAVF